MDHTEDASPDAYETLRKENERLREENRRMREELSRLKAAPAREETVSRQTPDDQEAVPAAGKRSAGSAPGQGKTLTPEEKVALFRSLFKGRKDVFARRWYSRTTSKSGYSPVCLNEWRTGVCDKKNVGCDKCPSRNLKAPEYRDYYAHLSGRAEDCSDVMGLYPVLEDNTCFFLCADFDDKSCQNGYRDDVRAYTEVCREWDIPCHTERSRSGKGAHVWIFFDGPVPAEKARRLGNAIFTRAMDKDARLSFKSYDRLFPNQDRLPEGGLGNLIALPLQGRARRQGNSVFVDGEFRPYADQWAYLQNAGKMSVEKTEALLGSLQPGPEFGELSTSTEEAPWETPKRPDLSRKDFPAHVRLTRANGIYVPLSGLPQKTVNHLKRLAAFKNRTFYEHQGMRLPTYNIPRIISCAEILKDYILLPRGCEDAVEELLDEKGVSWSVEDKTQHGRELGACFNGRLRDEQNRAVKELLSRNTGVLSAAPAFGKTVTAVKLIAERNTNTLILVHTTALLEQWTKRLEEFLRLPPPEEPQGEKAPARRGGRKKNPSVFGTLKSGKNTLRGTVDTALMQSCFEDGAVKPFVRDYGMIIVDECHHVSAAHFEQILRFATARYVYGLTATPVRKDGLQPVIFMQCGAIRYSGGRNPAPELPFGRFLEPRFTTFRHTGPEEDAGKFTAVQREISEDAARNEMIAKDVERALAEGRTPVVLAGLTSHVNTLYEMLSGTCENVVKLTGSETGKAKRESMERLAGIPPEEKLVIVATGRYVGEGFDYPRLDTLFLASPVSWRGIIEQYTGRLHREYPGKNDVTVYDYIDVRVPLCDKMYKRRLKGYVSCGYSIRPENALAGFVTGDSTIYNGTNFCGKFLSDLSAAAKSVIISAPGAGAGQETPVMKKLLGLGARGVETVVFTRPGDNAGAPKALCGVRHIAAKRAVPSAAVIDRKLAWYGDINFLGRVREDQNAIRITDPATASNLIDALYETAGM